jgi:hypothetical protein
MPGHAQETISLAARRTAAVSETSRRNIRIPTIHGKRNENPFARVHQAKGMIFKEADTTQDDLSFPGYGYAPGSEE